MSDAEIPAFMLSFEDARHVVEQHALRIQPHGKELVGLAEVVGQVLAEPVFADRDFPPFHRAARDGYAVRSADLAQVPAMLEVVAEIKAGPHRGTVPQIETGKAASIMTGAPVPPGADTVVMVEYTSRENSKVEIRKTAASGDNIVPSGAEARRGVQLLAPGARLDYAAIAVAASVGKRHLLVRSRPQVAILATGDELVDIEVTPGPVQIRNSNSYSLAAQVKTAGGDPILLPIAPDEPKRLRELLADGFETDLLLIAGGVSVGKYDLVEEGLREFQAEFFFTSAKIQPGRPIVFGRVPPGVSPADVAAPMKSDLSWKYFFGLPGNPVSTMVTFDLFVRPLLQAMAGASPQPLIFLRARLKSEVKVKTGLKRFLPAVLSGEFELAEVELVRWQGSGDIAAMARSNCYMVVPPDRERIEPGEWVPVLIR